MSETNGEAKKEEVKIVKLSHPINRMTGETVTELSIDPEEIDAEILHNIELEYAAVFPNVSPTNGIFITDSKYQLMLIGRINKMRYEEISKVKAKDALQLTLRLNRFLAVPA